MNLARHLPYTDGAEAVLHKEITVDGQGEATLRFGFSDELRLYVDGGLILEGEHTFHGCANPTDRPTRGYVEAGTNAVTVPLTAGSHTITARVKAAEPLFGWGLHLAITRQR